MRRYLLLFILACGIYTSFAQFARRVYSQPGKPFAMWIESSTPPRFAHLPKGLRWNADMHILEGTAPDEGTYSFLVCSGNDKDTVTLLVSRTLPQPTPFMGLLTWNVFEHDISEQKLHLLADAMEQLGLRDAGYSYLCIDDCWALPQRDGQGHLVPIPEKFPSGLKSLTDYIHSRRLHAGIYSDGGTFTCSHAQPGSLHHEDTDAADFALWGFDLLKYDFCYSDLQSQGGNGSSDTSWAIEVYLNMSQALHHHCADTFLFYICEWGRLKPWLWGAEAGGSCWRATDDTRDCWRNTYYKGGVMDNIEIFTRIWPYSGVNRFNDADMVMCGLHGKGRSSNAGTDGAGMTMDEYRTQFILWCMWSSPLTLCFDITTLHDGHSLLSDLYNPFYMEDLALITDSALIAINQDPLGLCARPCHFDTSLLILEKPLHDGTLVRSYTNLSRQEQSFALPSSLPAQARILIGKEAVTPAGNSILLKPHQTLLLQVSRQHPHPPLRHRKSRKSHTAKSTF